MRSGPTSAVRFDESVTDLVLSSRQTTKAAAIFLAPLPGPTHTTSSAVRHYPRATTDGWKHEVAATTQSALRTSGLHHRTRVPRTMRAHTSKSPPFVTARWTGACFTPLLRFRCGQLPAATERAKDANACSQVGQASPRARTVVCVEHHTPSHKLVEQRCVPLSVWCARPGPQLCESVTLCWPRPLPSARTRTQSRCISSAASKLCRAVSCASQSWRSSACTHTYSRHVTTPPTPL